jgi:hypothetical protein
MEVYQALSLMFMFGMFIIALLNYLKKKKTALSQRMRSISARNTLKPPPLKAAIA